MLAQRFRNLRLSSVQIIVFFYLACVLIPSILLWLPVFHKPGVHFSYIDALFTASSAISVTGLTVVTTHEIFNQWGILLLTLLFQIGGIGIMTLGTFFWLVLGQQIGLKQRKWIATDHNRPSLSGLVDLMRNILVMALAAVFEKRNKIHYLSLSKRKSDYWAVSGELDNKENVPIWRRFFLSIYWS